MTSSTRSQVVMRRAVEPWFFTFTLLALTFTGIAPILVPLYVARTDTQAMHVGLVMSAAGAGMLTAPLWGEVVGRFDCHRLLGSGGPLLVSAGLLLFPHSDAMAALLPLAFMMGCGYAAASTVSNLLILAAHPFYEVDARIGWLHLFVTLGTVAGLAVAGEVSQLPMPLGFTLAAAVAGVGGVLGAFTMKSPTSPPTSQEVQAARSSGAFPIPTQMVEAHDAPPGGGSRQGSALLIALWFVANLGMAGLNALYPLMMQGAFGVAPSTASFVMSFATALSLLLYVRSSRWTHVLGGRSMLTHGLLWRGLALALMFALGFVDMPWKQPVALALMSVATAVTPLLAVSSTIFVSELASDTGRAFGLYHGAAALAVLIGPVLAGRLADGCGYQGVILLGVTTVGLALLMARFLPGKAPAAGR